MRVVRRGWGAIVRTAPCWGSSNIPAPSSEFFILPERNLHDRAGGHPAERAVFTEPVAAACEILDQVRIPRGEPVGVLGDGKLGLLVAQVLHVHGYPVGLYGRHAAKLRVVGGVRRYHPLGRRQPARGQYGWVVDATGTEGLRQAAAMLRPRGTLILKSTVHGEVPSTPLHSSSTRSR